MGFDRFDETVLDSDDRVEVQAHLRHQLEIMEAVV